VYHGQNYETMDLLKSAQFSIEIETKFKLQIAEINNINGNQDQTIQ
jgi:hypothetical protein